MHTFLNTHGRVIITATIGLMLVFVVMTVISSKFGNTVVAEVETMFIEDKIIENPLPQYKINSFRVEFDDVDADNYYMNYQHYYNQVFKSVDGGKTFEGISENNIKIYLKCGAEDILIDSSLNYVSRMQFRGNYQLRYVITDNGRNYTYNINIIAD